MSARDGDLIAFGGAVSAKRFARIQGLLLPWWLRGWVTGPCVLYLFIFMGHDLDERFADPVGLVADVLLALGVLLMLWALTHFGRRRAWKQVTALHGAVAGSAGGDGIAWKTALSEARFDWVKFIKLRKSPDLLLLYYTPRCALYFPREFFASEGEWQAFEALVARRMPTRPN